MKPDFIPLSVPNFAGNEKTYVNDAVVSEWVSTGGSLVPRFEEEMAAYAGAPGAVACASGTAGLHLAMLVAGIGTGDEVLAPTLTFIAAVNPIRYAGAQPVFFGCDDSLCMDADAVRRFCAQQCEIRDGVLHNRHTGAAVRAIAPVHVFGNLANMDTLAAIAEEYHLLLIEDATEAVGSRFLAGRFAGRMAGTVSDVGVYSFNGNKIITTGAGGMLFSPHAQWLAHARHLSTQAKTDEVQYLHDEVGYNYRMTNLQAALGLAQLEQLEGFIAHKTAMYERYRQRLDGVCGLRILPFRKDIRSNHWFYSLYLEDFPLSRDTLLEKLRNEGIQTRTIWGLIHEQPPYQACQAFATEKAEDYRAHVLNLPCSTNITPEQVDRVCDAILALAGG
ncbi:LegC family aminotransferase [Ruminococcaceae bacterium OttesenSCG-928-O06]|nr:LegC family aminotransferase [Ruminococcaceae bacterium OttesenSCG-928-O06]